MTEKSTGKWTVCPAIDVPAPDLCLELNYAVQNYGLCCSGGGYKKEGHGPVCKLAETALKGGAKKGFLRR